MYIVNLAITFKSIWKEHFTLNDKILKQIDVNLGTNGGKYLLLLNESFTRETGKTPIENLIGN